MSQNDLLEKIISTAHDRRVSTGEQKSLSEVIDEAALTSEEQLRIRAGLFAKVASTMKHPEDRKWVEWLEDAVKLLDISAEEWPPSRAFFGPEAPMVETLVKLINTARNRIDIAVFTITDNRLSQELVDAHRRGVKIRILTDDDKAHDRGSDAIELAKAGIPLAYDHSPHHFHHKFAIVDRMTLVNGSYNWTRGADRDNRENFTLCWEQKLVKQYEENFEKMWKELG